MAMGNVPYSVIVEVAAAKDVFLIPLPDDVMRRLLQANRGLWRFTVPAGTYRGQDQPYQTLAAGVHIVARKDLPDDVVEQVTRVLVESLPKFQEQFAFMKATTPAVMAQDVGIPFHPGSEKYYRSKGLLK
jgi:TRAP transporter TAXI family solute receptor